MNKILLGFIDNMRPEMLDATILSTEKNLKGDFVQKIIINDSGVDEYHFQLLDRYGSDYKIISHKTNRGLSGSVRTLWEIADELDIDYIWHQEGDFTFNENINVNTLLNIFDPYIAQVTLKRQPVNNEEANYGGFMQRDRASYDQVYRGNIKYSTHRNFFTLNPGLYPRWVINLGWEQGWGEKEFGERLFSNHLVKCAYYGWVDDPPLVNHIGVYRGGNWFV
jgi:uncharacterized protein YifE (UPF0438 family)